MKVSPTQIRAFLEAIELGGARPEAILERAGFDAARLDQSNDWIAVEEYDKLIEAGLELTGDPALGLHWGERATMMRFGVVAPLVANSRTMRAAIAALTRYTRILSERSSYELLDRGETAILACERPPATLAHWHVVAELAVVGFARMVQFFGGTNAAPLAVYFDFPRPSYASEYARIFGCAEHFDQAFSGVEFDRRLLDRPQLHFNADLYRAFEAEAERALARAIGNAHAERLRSHLVQVFPRRPDMNEAARELGLSERSLRRRLSEERVSYADLVNEVQATAAKRLLQRSTIQETAYHMGFSSPSAFHRAFKRWTGQSPREFRRELSNHPSPGEQPES